MSHKLHIGLKIQSPVGTVLRSGIDPRHGVLQLRSGYDRAPGAVGVVLTHARIAGIHEIRIRTLVLDGEREPRIRIPVVGGDVQIYALGNAVRKAKKRPKRMRRRGDVGCPTALWAAGPAATREAATAAALLQEAAGTFLEASRHPPRETLTTVRGAASILVQVQEDVDTCAGEGFDCRIELCSICGVDLLAIRGIGRGHHNAQPDTGHYRARGAVRGWRRLVGHLSGPFHHGLCICFHYLQRWEPRLSLENIVSTEQDNLRPVEFEYLALNGDAALPQRRVFSHGTGTEVKRSFF
mmetsp:Transcript_105245/g.250543  ORF Transcript_105245/g.250543 Transcript_105245/m.250543 type:complete len:296 (+) Transcript_105245:894-1781(+)